MSGHKKTNSTKAAATTRAQKNKTAPVQEPLSPSKSSLDVSKPDKLTQYLAFQAALQTKLKEKAKPEKTDRGEVESEDDDEVQVIEVQVDTLRRDRETLSTANPSSSGKKLSSTKVDNPATTVPSHNSARDNQPASAPSEPLMLKLKRSRPTVGEPDSEIPLKKTKDSMDEFKALLANTMETMTAAIHQSNASTQAILAKVQESTQLHSGYKEMMEAQLNVTAYYFDFIGRHLQTLTGQIAAQQAPLMGTHDVQRHSPLPSSRLPSPNPMGYPGFMTGQNDGTVLGIPHLLPISHVLRSVSEGRGLPVSQRNADSSSLRDLPPLGSPPPMPQSHSHRAMDST